MWPARSSNPVYAEQVRSSYLHLPLTLSVSILNSTLLGFVLAPVVPVLTVVVWIGFVVGLSCIRTVLWYAHRHLDVGSDFNPHWGDLAAAGAFVSGMLWGAAPFVFSPLDGAYLLFLALVLSGMCAGAATVHAAHFPSMAGFIIPTILPLSAHFFIQGGRLYTVAGITAVVFAVSICVASLNFEKWFRNTTSARIALAEQALEINEANSNLQAEIASHRATAERLQQAEKMEAIGRLTAGIAHDFNHLLGVIGLATESIERDLPSASVHGRHVATIVQSVDRGAALTQQLLAFGRKQTLVPQSADLNELLSGIEQLLITALDGHGRLQFQLDSEPTPAFVDKAQLEQVILNLVINARDALLVDGVVTIKTAKRDLHGEEGLFGRFAMISVADTGAGMSEDVCLRAFEPFFTTRTGGTGSGLGLSQVYGFVQQSGGATRIDSLLDVGTTVSLYLPRTAENAV